jgi:branched-chain amino acid transport system ATP-binding protein
MPGNKDNCLLEMERVTKFFGGLTAVHDFSTSVQMGELLSIIGPNGAGKTTVLNLISGVFPITRGEIRFKGQRIDGIAPFQICGLGVGRTFQNLQLFANMSAVQNVMIGCHKWMNCSLPEVIFRSGRVRKEEKEARERAMERLSFLGLEGKADEMPSNLALKERKLLGLARALATEPELLLLDEPVGGLTYKEIDDFAKKIVKMRERGLTIIFIEHRMELVIGVSERVIVMDFGRIIAEGTFEEVRDNQEVIAAYLGKR